jgi:PRTRC genetic system protein E
MLLVNAVGDDQLSIAVLPQGDFDGDRAALGTPLQITGTVEELSAGVEGALAQYTASRKSLEDQLSETIAVLDAAKKASAEKSKKAVTKAAASKAATSVADKDDDSNDDDDSDATVTTAPPASVAKPAAKPDAFALNLD